MEKIAQKRESRLRKLLTTDIGDYYGGKAVEKRSPEFAQVIQELNEIDDGIRAIVLGESYGEADAPGDAIGLKELLKSAKTNFNRREYIKGVSDLSRFHKKVGEIVFLLSKFKSNLDKVHEKFLFEGLDDDTQKHLKTLQERWPKKASIYSEYLVKEANILDLLHNLFNERGQALAAWEKRYPSKVKKLKNDSVAILTSSEKLLNTILSSLKIMDKARTVRNPDAYMVGADKIVQTYKNYDEGDKGFKKYYESNIRDFLESQEFMKSVVKDTTTAPQQILQQPVGTSGAPPQDPMAPPPPPPPPPKPAQIPPPPPIPPMPPSKVVDPTKTNTQTLAPPQVPDVDVPDLLTTIKDPIPPIPPPKKAHKKFFDSLKSMSNESPLFISAHINRYAKSILVSDPETSIELLKIAKSIKG